MKKKKKRCRKLEWAIAHICFFKCESQYNKLYCDTRLDRHDLGDRLGSARGAHGRSGYGRLGHDTGHDTANGGHDIAMQLARATWLMDCVATNSFVS